MSDPQDQAELLDEDVVDATDDRSGDRYGATLPDYPPEAPLGVEATGTTPIEEDAGESFAERSGRYRPDTDTGDDDAADLGAEDAAVHVERPMEENTADDAHPRDERTGPT